MYMVGGLQFCLSYPRRVRPGFRNARHCAGRTPKPCRDLAGTSRYSLVVSKRVWTSFCGGEKPGVARRQLTFLASPRKVSQRRRPQVRRPDGKAVGVPCAAHKRGPLRNSGSNGQHGCAYFCARPQTVLADPSRVCSAFGKPLHLLPARQALMSAGTSAKPLPPLRLSWGPLVAMR